MIDEITKCRICDNTELIPVVDLGEQYLTGIFPKNNPNESLTKGPLRLMKCHGGKECCGLLQLAHSYDLNELYGDNYGYRSGLNANMVGHLHRKVADIIERCDLNKGDLVVDIGSNDGSTLAAYPEYLQLVGIDPTGEKFRSYYEKHIALIPEFFSSDLISRSFPEKKVKVVTSLSMFYDQEDPVDFSCQVAGILDSHEGVWVLEQSYMPLMLERTAYDTICHEHLEYYGLKQIVWLMDKAGLKVVDVELNDVNGGSFSVVVAHKGSKHKDVNNIVDRLIASEEKKRLSSFEPYKQFARRVEEKRKSIQDFVQQAKQEGKRICGLGASTKGNVILQYCGFGPRDIEMIGDVNEDKYGALTPGTWIPIEAEEKVLASKPDYLLVLPWHFREFFLSKPKYIGHKLVLNGADVTIVDAMIEPFGANLFNLTGIREKVTVNIADIRDIEAMKVLVKDKDIIFNLAGQISHNDSIENPLLDADLNYIGQLKIMEQVRKYNPGARVLFAGSRLQFGEINKTPVKEDHALSPKTPYAFHKTVTEKMYEFYHDVHSISTIVFRIANPYGIRAQMKHSKYCIVNYFLRLAMEDLEISIFGDGQQLRDYIYIEDLAEAMIITSVIKNISGEVFNVGSGIGTTFKEMVECVVEIVGKGSVKYIPWPDSYLNVETGDYISDITKIVALTNWRPKYNLQSGIKNTFNFYQKYAKHYF